MEQHNPQQPHEGVDSLIVQNSSHEGHLAVPPLTAEIHSTRDTEASAQDWASFGDWCERDKRDAARYRYLRDHGLKYANVGLGTTCEGVDVVDFSPTFTIPEPAGMHYEENEWSLTDLDAAIDAAMAQGEQRDA